jgi:uncharacterized protein (DUF427 family)
MGAAMAQVADQTAPATGRRGWTESNARRATVLTGGRAVADSTPTIYLSETAHLPVDNFPRPNVARFDLLASSAHHTHGRYTDDASCYSAASGDRRAEDAIWAHEEPISPVRQIVGCIAPYRDRADGWYGEDGEVFAHPRDPHKRVDVPPSARHVKVRIAADAHG